MTFKSNYPLTEFLWNSGDKFFVRGRRDCGLWLADWFMFARQAPDPIPDLRGKYLTEAQVIADGGLLRIMRQVVRRLGLEETEAPLHGDIGIIRTLIGPAGSIRGKYGWFVLAPDMGIMNLGEEIDLLKAWQI